MGTFQFREAWLNNLQTCCFFIIWLTFQAGLMVITTTPTPVVGNALLIALGIANVVILVSPALLVLLALLSAIPESLRNKWLTRLGFGTKSRAAMFNKSQLELIRADVLRHHHDNNSNQNDHRNTLRVESIVEVYLHSSVCNYLD